MLKSHDDQQQLRKNKLLNEKILDQKYYEENLIPLLQAHKKEEISKQRQKIETIKKYKAELDRQVEENKKIKYSKNNPRSLENFEHPSKVEISSPYY